MAPPYSRREFIKTSLALAASAGLGGCGGGSQSTALAALSVLPAPAASNIDHVVLVVMENRSFDHFLGWVPGADGVQAGLHFYDAFDNLQSTYPLAPDYQGCGKADPDHSYVGGRTQYNGGRMDGWLLTPGTNQTAGDLFPIGYYTEADLPFFSGCAANWTICDSYHCGILSETYPNRFYLHSGQTDRLTNTTTISTLPTIFDRFKAKGLSANYYYSDIPFLALWGSKYTDGTAQPIASFLAAAAAGSLPAFSHVDPGFSGESTGTTNDDHPWNDIRNGQVFLNQIYDAVRTGPAWDKTLLIITYDEWGGFFEHVPPAVRPVSAAEAALGNDGRLGFRVPMVLIGPTAKRRYVNSLPFDPSSIHSLLEWRFGLDPLGVRDADPSTINLAHALDFSSTSALAAPAFAVGTSVYGGACPNGSPAPGGGLPQLSSLASQYGFPTP